MCVSPNVSCGVPLCCEVPLSQASNLKIIYTNIDCFNSPKKNELLVQISRIKPQFVCLTEVLHKSPNSQWTFSNINIDGYAKHHPDNDKSKRGVMIFVLNELDAKPIPELNAHTFQEAYFLNISYNKQNLICGVVYRSPNSTLENDKSLNELIDLASNLSISSKLMLVGDFNYKDIDWKSYSSKHSLNHPVSNFLDTLLKNNLFQHVDSYTRYRGNDRPSCLDLVLSNTNDLITSLDYNPPIGNSDHAVLNFVVDFSVDCHTPSQVKEIFDFKKADFTAICNQLSGADWTGLFNEKSADDC